MNTNTSVTRCNLLLHIQVLVHQYLFFSIIKRRLLWRYCFISCCLLLATEGRIWAGVFPVSNANAAGACPCSISFSTPHIINIHFPLPAITVAGVSASGNDIIACTGNSNVYSLIDVNPDGKVYYNTCSSGQCFRNVILYNNTTITLMHELVSGYRTGFLA